MSDNLFSDQLPPDPHQHQEESPFEVDEPQELNEEQPTPMQVLLAANAFIESSDPLLREECAQADLVVSLGGVDLEALAEVVPPGVPGLAILGPEDPVAVPEPFQVLHGDGVNFKGWKIAGIGGERKIDAASGLFLSDQESMEILESLDASDIFLSNTFPTSLQDSMTQPEFGMPALDEYIRSKSPLYHFYGHPSGVVDMYVESPSDETLCVGICGYFLSPVLESL